MKNKEEKYLVLYQEEGNLRYMEITEADADHAESLNGIFYKQSAPEDITKFYGYEIHEIKEYRDSKERPATLFILRKKVQQGYLYDNLLVGNGGYWILVEN